MSLGNAANKSDLVSDWLPKRGRWLGILIVFVATVSGVIAGRLWTKNQPEDQTQAVSSPPGVEVLKGHQPPHDLGVSVAEKTTQPAAPAVAQKPAAINRPPPFVEVEMTSEPSGAMVYEGKQSMGYTPITLMLQATQHSSLVLKLEGYEDALITWTPKDTRTINVVLKGK